MRVALRFLGVLTFSLAFGQSFAARPAPRISTPAQAVTSVKQWFERKDGGPSNGALDWQANLVNARAIKKEIAEKLSEEGRHGWNAVAGDSETAKKAKKLWRVSHVEGFWSYVTFLDPASGAVVLQFKSIEG